MICIYLPLLPIILMNHFTDVFVGNRHVLTKTYRDFMGLQEGKRLNQAEANHLPGICAWERFAIAAVTQNDTTQPAEILCAVKV